MTQQPLRVCVVGAGTRFLSGISVYTVRLANALAQVDEVSAVLMRQLLPSRLYPGRARVGVPLDKLSFDPSVRVYDGVDWHWFPSILPALLRLVHQRPDIVVFQWWTGTVLHSYLLLAFVTRLLGGRIVIEFHEVLDTGEANMPLVNIYVRTFFPLLLHMADGFTAHSEHDKALLEQQYDFGNRPVVALPHGPHDHYQNSAKHTQIMREAPPDCCNLLFFGVIRPYKGLEDLIAAFDAVPEQEINDYWLTIVGETWEGWTLPNALIERSRYRDRITFINRYVHDDEVAAFFAGADAVVLPYHRASMSGPLHVAMGYGLPIVISDVGGLSEAMEGYEGTILIPPKSPIAIGDGLRRAATLRGRRFTHPRSWEHTAASYSGLFSSLLAQRRLDRKISA